MNKSDRMIRNLAEDVGWTHHPETDINEEHWTKEERELEQWKY